MNRLIYDLPEERYHRDDLTSEEELPPTLSASIAARIVLAKPGYGSALNAWAFHPRLGGISEAAVEETPEKIKQKERGKLLHTLILGRGASIVEVNAKAWNTNAAKEARAAAWADGKQAVLVERLRRYENMAEVIKKRIAARRVAFDGHSEVTGIWVSDGVTCRRRFDHIPRTTATVLELKTCASAHPDVCRRTTEAFGYDISAAASIECMETIHPHLKGEIAYKLVFCEVTPPHDVTVIDFSPSMLELGRRRWERARGIWKTCLAADRWPGYSEGVVTIDASEWAIKRETELEYNANPGADF